MGEEKRRRLAQQAGTYVPPPTTSRREPTWEERVAESRGMLERDEALFKQTEANLLAVLLQHGPNSDIYKTNEQKVAQVRRKLADQRDALEAIVNP